MHLRLIQTTNAAGGVTQFTLDPAGNTTKLVDADGNATSWTYSSVNLPLTETNSLGTTATTYDLDRDVTSIQDADGRVRDFVYDNDQRLTAENWMNGNHGDSYGNRKQSIGAQHVQFHGCP